MELTLTKINHFSKDKTGAVLTTKNGKPYTRCLINVQEYGSQAISGFGNQTTQSWQEGDKINVDIEEKKVGDKVYLNFSIPKKELAGSFTQEDRASLARIEHLLIELKSGIAFLAKTPDDYPENDLPPSEF